jgi:hypothetical protein
MLLFEWGLRAVTVCNGAAEQAENWRANFVSPADEVNLAAQKKKSPRAHTAARGRRLGSTLPSPTSTSTAAMVGLPARARGMSDSDLALV